MEFDVFKRSHCNFKKLAPYGFNQTGDNWLLERLLMDGAFRAVVTITPKGEVNGKVYDADFDEEYLALREKGQRGGFVQQVREAYKNLLEEIREHCLTVFIEIWRRLVSQSRNTDSPSLCSTQH